MVKSEKVTLVGGGLVGSLLSLFLARRGFEVEVLERRPDMRINTISAGRSINLALSTRGIHALNQVGLEKEILKLSIPMLGRMVHAVNGETNLQKYGRDDSEYINSISRSDLNKILMTCAEKTGLVKFSFNRNITGTEEFKGLVIGTDGSASAIRKKISPNAEEDYLNYGYKELIIPAGPGGKFLLEKNALHIWPRGTFMLIALPNLDGSFTATLFLPMSGENSFEDLNSATGVESFFESKFVDVIKLFPNLAADFSAHPMGRMVTVKSSAWHKDGKACLVGDAAHAIVPFFGQGMNCGFEDCTVLDQILKEEKSERWENIFEKFFEARKVNCDAIADMAVENFIEMRDKVAQPKYLFEKAIEKILVSHFPRDYISRYQLVTFTRVPYSVALQAGIIQNEILEKLSHGLTKPQEVNIDMARQLIAEKFTPYLREFKKENYGFRS